MLAGDCVICNTLQLNDLDRPYRAFLLFVRFTQAVGLGWHRVAPLVREKGSVLTFDS